MAGFESGDVRFEDAVITGGRPDFRTALFSGGTVTFDGFHCDSGEVEKSPFVGQIN